MNKPFCVFIISHGRPDKVVTLRTLKQCGYTGPLFIVCDNEDKTIDQYRKNHGADVVLVFDKPHYASLVDSCDNFENRRTTTHARNACFDLAKKLNVEYFLVLDDDYTYFGNIYRSGGLFLRRRIYNIDQVFAAVTQFLNSDERIDSICFIQAGDLIGGLACTNLERGVFPFKKRKAMNSFFCKTSRRFWFFSRLNEDVNTYLHLGNRGRLFFSIPDILLYQSQTQTRGGGMTDAYLASGTYVKSFYTTMICPSFASVRFDDKLGRIHHKIIWNNAVPKILAPEHRKA